MKVKFVKGVAGHRGAMVTPFEGKMVAGFYRRHLYENEKRIIVVKQRSIWFTILIFIHELAHCFVRGTFSGERQYKLNVWIDEYIKRPRDRR